MAGSTGHLHMNQCADLLALDKPGEVAFPVHVEHDDRHVAFAAEGKRRLVHDLEPVLYRLVETKLIIFHSRRILLRIRRIYSVNARYYMRDDAVAVMEKGGVALIAGGTGNPYFTTDSGAALRALEIGANKLLGIFTLLFS